MRTHRFLASPAFTLLEMAIALAIIGLLAGAIVGAQSYIRSSKLSTAVGEARYYLNAFNQFQHTYSQVPGDMSTASSVWSTAGNGDGSGCINYPSNKPELFYVWQHLADAQLIQGTYTGVAGPLSTKNGVPGVNLPGSSVDQTGFWFQHVGGTAGDGSGYISGSANLFDGFYGNYLALGGYTPSSTGLPGTVFLTPQETNELDVKFDDGMPGTGWMRVPPASAMANCASSSVAASATYSTTYKGAACYLIFVQR